MILPVDAASIAAAAEALRRGEVVAYPTETVYGLGADPRSPEAVDRLFQVKGRAQDQPVLLIIAEPEDFERIVVVSDAARRCIDAFWPGPLTLVLPAKGAFPSGVQAPDGTVAVRCPACPAARALARAFGGPITSTSANRAGAPPALRAADAALDGVFCVLDGGELPPSAPSTVYAPDRDEILREGALSAEALRRLEPQRQ